MTRRAAVLAVLLLLGGCARTGGAEGPVRSLPVNRTFMSTSVTDSGHDRPLVAGTTITVTFDEGLVALTAGCNTMSGRAGLDAGSLVVGSLAITTIGCPDALGKQDSWLGTFLTSRPVVTLAAGVLTLRAGTVVITLNQAAR